MSSIALTSNRAAAVRAVVVTTMFILAVFAIGARAEDDVLDIDLETEIVSAIVYGHQAQIVRHGSVDLSVGEVSVVCADLPKTFNESSLIVEGRGSADAQIVGIDFEWTEVDYTDDPRYQELLLESRAIEDQKNDIKIQRSAVRKRASLMSSVSDLSAAGGNSELASGDFSMERWLELAAFFEEQSLRTERRLRELDGRVRALEDRQTAIGREEREIRTKARRRRELVIACEVEEAGELEFDVTYVIGGASWRPEYTVRYLEARDEVELTYAARIEQRTGEDWEGVDVLLSTASPHIGASPPSMFPHVLGAIGGTIAGRVTDATTGAPLAFANITLVGLTRGVIANRDGFFEIHGLQNGKYSVEARMMGYDPGGRSNVRVLAGATKRIDIALRPVTIAGSEMLIEMSRPMIETEDTSTRRGMDRSEMRALSTTAEAIATQPGVVLHDGEIHVRGGRSSEVKMYVDGIAAPHREMSVAGSEAATNLVIAKPVDLESGADARRVLVVKRRIPGRFVREAVPRYSDHVFVRGTLENPLDVPILSGPAEVYVESEPAHGGPAVTNFVGKDAIADVAPGEEFAMYLGADQSLKVEHDVEREVLSRTGSRKTKVRYTMSIVSESFRRSPAELWVLDRVPVSLLKDIDVKDVEVLPEADTHDEEGVLTWKLTLDAGESVEVGAIYTVEYPSDFTAQAINLE